VKRITVIAFDPGEQTGWARGYVQVPEDGPPSLCVQASGYAPWKQVLLAYARTMLGDEPYDRTVYESWRLRGDTAMSLIGSDLQSSQFIGGVKLMVWLNQTRGRPVQIATNEPGNKTSIDGWMAAAGRGDYLPSSPVEHNRDALRHIHFDAIKRLGVKEEDCHYVADDRPIDGEVIE
jgi:hypothetical protein